jgi:hypothetical protein
MDVLFFFLLGRFFLSLEVDGDDVSAAMSSIPSIAVEALRFVADVDVFVVSALTLVHVIFWDDGVFGAAAVAVVPVVVVIVVVVATVVGLAAMDFDEIDSAVGLDVTVIA